jgi:23S rRNA G2445 N2-methylase RlmL
MDFKKLNQILVTCAKGVSPVLKTELEKFEYEVHHETSLGVFIRGSLEDAIYLNMSLRTGLRVLYLVDKFQAQTPDDLYRHVSAMPWEDVLYPDGFFSITSSVSNEYIQDSRFANLKCKDAVVDRLQESFGRRPDTGPDRSKAVLFMYWKDNECSIYIDTSGEPLSRRGYRKIPMKAPMQESLAAATLLAAGWTGDGHFINPMCGSGTVAIEAALIALNRGPGLLRHNFGFMHIRGYEKDDYTAIRKKVNSQSKKQIPFKIIVSDIDNGAVAGARQNARTAGVEHLCEFQRCDFRDTPLPEGKGAVYLNPAYGVRLEEEKLLEKTYAAIGDFFKQQCQGYFGYIFTGNLSLAKKVGLKTKRRLTFYNGPIEARLLEYEIYGGSR